MHSVHKSSFLFDGHLNATSFLGWIFFPGAKSESEKQERGEVVIKISWSWAVVQMMCHLGVVTGHTSVLGSDDVEV